MILINAKFTRVYSGDKESCRVCIYWAQWKHLDALPWNGANWFLPIKKKMEPIDELYLKAINYN